MTSSAVTLSPRSPSWSWRRPAPAPVTGRVHHRRHQRVDRARRRELRDGHRDRTRKAACSASATARSRPRSGAAGWLGHVDVRGGAGRSRSRSTWVAAAAMSFSSGSIPGAAGAGRHQRRWRRWARHDRRRQRLLPGCRRRWRVRCPRRRHRISTVGSSSVAVAAGVGGFGGSGRAGVGGGEDGGTAAVESERDAVGPVVRRAPVGPAGRPTACGTTGVRRRVRRRRRRRRWRAVNGGGGGGGGGWYGGGGGGGVVPGGGAAAAGGGGSGFGDDARRRASTPATAATAASRSTYAVGDTSCVQAPLTVDEGGERRRRHRVTTFTDPRLVPGRHDRVGATPS